MSQELREDERARLDLELASVDEEERRQAALRVHLLPAREAVPRWIACLGDPAWRVRKVAVELGSAWPIASAERGDYEASLAAARQDPERTELLQALAQVWPAYEAALTAHGVPYQMYTYPGTRHGFHNNSTPRYDAAAAHLAWERTSAFFKAHLG